MNDIEILAYFMSGDERTMKVKLSIGRHRRVHHVRARREEGGGNGIHLYKSPSDKIVGALTFELRLEGQQEKLHLPDYE